MLVAQKLDPNYNQPQPDLNLKRRSQAMSKTQLRSIQAVIVLAVAVLFATGLFLASQAAAVTNKGYEITNLKNEIESLKIANERLKLEIAQLDSLERVEAIAVADLGMQKPSVQNFRLLPMDGIDTAVTVAESETEDSSTSKQKLAQADWSLLKRIASAIIHLQHVEASEL